MVSTPTERTPLAPVRSRLMVTAMTKTAPESLWRGDGAPAAPIPRPPLPIRIGVLRRVAAAQRLVLAVVTGRAGRQVLRRADFQLVAAVRALVGAGRDVA